MSVFDWIEMARSLDADGLEMYDGFFTSLDDAYLDRVGEAIHAAGFAMPMLCCSPDFTNPDPDARKRAVDREAEMIRVTRRLGGPGAVCRVLSRPALSRASSREQGLEWVVGVHRAGAAGRPRARRRPRAGEPLQGRLLEVPRVRPEAGRVPRTARRHPRPRRTSACSTTRRTPIVAGDDPIALLRGRRRPRREHARQRPLPRRGDDAGRAPPGRRHARLLARTCGTASPARG